MSKPIQEAVINLRKYWYDTTETLPELKFEEVEAIGVILDNVLSIEPKNELEKNQHYYLLVTMKDWENYEYKSLKVSGNMNGFEIPEDNYFVFGLKTEE